MKFSNLNPPPISHQSVQVDPYDLKVSQWLTKWDGLEEIDAVLAGVPLSRSSISASGASEAPLAVRQSWRSFTTYDVDHEIDLSSLRVRDLGDIRMHTTDILACHQRIQDGCVEILAKFAPSPVLFLGGDHSITCPLVKACSHHFEGKRIGLIQFDTHFDVRRLEDGGPSNGTPIRGLLEAGTLHGKDIVQIGIHGFANSFPYHEYVREQGISIYTMRQVREKGLQTLLQSAVRTLEENIDLIYVTVDMDVLDQGFLPGSPGASPGGMIPWELFEAVHMLGQQPKVMVIDFVCFDPLRDVGGISAKTVTHTLLSFLSGYCKRQQTQKER